VLEVPVSFFYEDMPDSISQQSPRLLGSGVPDEELTTIVADQLSRRETVELVRAYYRIGDPVVRKSLINLTKVINRIAGDDAL